MSAMSETPDKKPVVVEIVYTGADFDGLERMTKKDDASGSRGSQQCATFTLFDSKTDTYVELRLPLFNRKLIMALGPYVDTACGIDGSHGITMTVRIEIDPKDEEDEDSA